MHKDMDDMVIWWLDDMMTWWYVPAFAQQGCCGSEHIFQQLLNNSILFSSYS